MSIAQIKSAVESFLSSSDNEFLMLKGSWGVGKTFFWRETLHSVAQNDKLKKSGYTYVSLFGLNGLQDLKDALFANNIDIKEIKKGKFADDIINQLKKNSKNFEQIPYINKLTGGIINNSILFSFVKDSIICIDDLERRGKDFNLKDIFGLLSFLRDQRNCKIALIVNDNVLSEDEKKLFKIDAEKLIDIEIRFTLSSEEAFSYVFRKSDAYYDYIRNRCSILSIKNIRTIQRIKRYISGVMSELRGYQIEVYEQIISHLILFAWCYYESEGGAPSISHLRKFSLYVELHKEQKGGISGEISNWNSILKKYGYLRTGNLEECLMKFVETGYLDVEWLTKEASQQDNIVRSGQASDKIRKAWNIFHSSFSDNQEEFSQKLIEGFESGIMFMGLSELQSTFQTLEQLGKRDAGEKLVAHYIDVKKDDISKVDTSHPSVAYPIRSDYVISEIEKHQRLNDNVSSIKDILDEIIKDQSKKIRYANRLSLFSPDDFYNFFKSINSDMLRLYIRNCTDYMTFGEQKETREIVKNVRSALQRIASESNINRMRIMSMQELGVDLVQEAAEAKAAE